MAGQIKMMLDSIIQQRAQGNQIVAGAMKTKLLIKGLNVERFTSASPDDPEVIKKVRVVAAEFGVTV